MVVGVALLCAYFMVHVKRVGSGLAWAEQVMVASWPGVSVMGSGMIVTMGTSVEYFVTLTIRLLISDKNYLGEEYPRIP